MTKANHRRIGVLTFHNGPNFGGYMQAWHLVHSLRTLGYRANAVNYLHPTHHHSNTAEKPLKNWPAVKARVHRFLHKRGFRNIEDSICSHPFTTDPAKVPWDDFDAFVVGSDVVWDYQSPGFGNDPAYFGMVPGLKGKPIIAYAASCGQSSADGPYPPYVVNGIKSFNKIGVRDDSTRRLAMNAGGRESTLVVDPTWLNPDPNISMRTLPRKEYLFVYGRPVSAEIGDTLLAYCRSRNLELVSGLTTCKQADRRYHTLTPFQWVELFKHAKATAIMGTLHGTLFSIKYNKPFIVLNAPSVTQKIAQVLERTSQQFRLVSPEEISLGKLEMLDHDKVTIPHVPSDWVSESRHFLSNSLQQALR